MITLFILFISSLDESKIDYNFPWHSWLWPSLYHTETKRTLLPFVQSSLHWTVHWTVLYTVWLKKCVNITQILQPSNLWAICLPSLLANIQHQEIINPHIQPGNITEVSAFLARGRSCLGQCVRHLSFIWKLILFYFDISYREYLKYQITHLSFIWMSGIVDLKKPERGWKRERERERDNFLVKNKRKLAGDQTRPGQSVWSLSCMFPSASSGGQSVRQWGRIG